MHLAMSEKCSIAISKAMDFVAKESDKLIAISKYKR